MISKMMFINLALFLCAVFGIIYLIASFSKKDMPIYCVSVLCAWISLALCRLYMFLVLLVESADLNKFNLSWFAMIGSFIFLFCANYGCLDKGTLKIAKGNAKQKMISLAAPVVVIGLYVFNMYLFYKYDTRLTVSYRIFTVILTLLIMQSSFFNLKYIIIGSDKESSLYKLRSFNFIMLVYSFLTMVEVSAPISRSFVAIIVIYSLIAVTTLMIPVCLRRGMK